MLSETPSKSAAQYNGGLRAIWIVDWSGNSYPSESEGCRFTIGACVPGEEILDRNAYETEEWKWKKKKKEEKKERERECIMEARESGTIGVTREEEVIIELINDRTWEWYAQDGRVFRVIEMKEKK